MRCFGSFARRPCVCPSVDAASHPATRRALQWRDSSALRCNAKRASRPNQPSRAFTQAVQADAFFRRRDRQRSVYLRRHPHDEPAAIAAIGEGRGRLFAAVAAMSARDIAHQLANAGERLLRRIRQPAKGRELGAQAHVFLILGRTKLRGMCSGRTLPSPSLRRFRRTWPNIHGRVNHGASSLLRSFAPTRVGWLGTPARPTAGAHLAGEAKRRQQAEIPPSLPQAYTVAGHERGHATPVSARGRCRAAGAQWTRGAAGCAVALPCRSGLPARRRPTTLSWWAREETARPHCSIGSRAPAPIRPWMSWP